MKERLKKIAMGLIDLEIFDDVVKTANFVDRDELEKKQSEVEFRKEASAYLFGLAESMGDDNFISEVD
ncbi:hypothetical protein [Pseudoalteromonas sp.]|uniref:hypothetical protein n=1 Tax=Pseudoalteromonas sp. TaxID=53249 RepID=UPI002634F556|nr:hypothetical protein [Pseudoalteromonas sp.]MCP4585358.1 hypothetical protein [Pseudoalteromonas sp.]